MFRVAVTGGAGFIGSALVRFLLEHRPEWHVTTFDLLTYSGNIENLADVMESPRHRFVRGDVCDRAAVDEVIGSCDAMFHLAAESHVDRSILDAAPFVRTNVLGTQVILDSLRAAKEKGRTVRLVHVSTDEVYGSLPLSDVEAAFDESSALAPNNPYAASKAAADCLVRAAHHTYGLDVIITRCTNNLGPRQYPEKVIPLFVTNLLRGKQVPLYGDGLNVRDWIHVDDHCAALLSVMERSRGGEVYNIASGNQRSNLELTQAILGLLGHGKEMIQHVQDRPGHDQRYALSTGKIEREIGWRPVRSAWPEALADTVAWYRENVGWWEKLVRD